MPRTKPEEQLEDLLNDAGDDVTDSTENLGDTEDYDPSGTTTGKATPIQRFLELAKQKEGLVEQLKQTNEALESVMQTIGVGKMFQDPSTSLVYKVCVPKGKYVAFPPIDYVRTKKLDEERGELSFTEAEASGFNVDSLKKSKKK